jgi:hypothetical protein
MILWGSNKTGVSKNDAGARSGLPSPTTVANDVKFADIESMYSLVPIEDLPGFLQSLVPGVLESNKLATERMYGAVASNCATILIPLHANDCVCHFVLDRDTALALISRYSLSCIKAE